MASARTQKTTVTFQREPRLAKPDTAPRISKVTGLCYECCQPGHHWHDCPERKPPGETPGKVRASQRVTSLAVSAAHSHEKLEDRCQILRQEWVDAELCSFLRAVKGRPTLTKLQGLFVLCITAW